MFTSRPTASTLSDDPDSMKLVARDGSAVEVQVKLMRAVCPRLVEGFELARSLPEGADEIHFRLKRPVLNAFVQVLITGQAPTPSKLKLNHLRSLLALTKDLGCHKAFEACLLNIDTYAADPGSDPYYAFLTGAENGRWHACALAISQYGVKGSRSKIWRKQDKHESEMDKLLGCIIGTPWVDPTGMPFHLWQSVPKKCLWALLRACTEKENWQDRGEMFEVLMNTIDGECNLCPHDWRYESADRAERNAIWPQFAGDDSD